MKSSVALTAILSLLCILIINCSDEEVTSPPDQNDNSEEPAVIINSPDDGATFTAGTAVSFACSGEDYHGAAIPDSGLVWESDQDDTIGTGSSFDRDDLSVNTHVITLTATDSEGNDASTGVTISITLGEEMVSVPATAGFPMGSDSMTSHEEPVHAVSISAFRIARYEVTYALWMDVKNWADQNGYIMNDGLMGDGCDTNEQHPVTNIHWRDCIAWCNARSQMESLTPVYYTGSDKLAVYKDASHEGDGNIGSDCVKWSANGYRLPTEAEWEYAARYIDGSSYTPGNKHSGYNLYPDIYDCGWFAGNSVQSSKPVGQLQPNSLGICDMSGNVYEWCWDWYQADYYSESPSDNPKGPDTGIYRIYRGGSFNMTSTGSNYGFAAFRFAYWPYSINTAGGFRVCRSGSGN